MGFSFKNERFCMDFHTFPSENIIAQKAALAQPYMRPNKTPFAVVAEGYLTDQECDAVLWAMAEVEPYEFSGCGAVTRECPYPLTEPFQPIANFTKTMNMFYWDYDIDDEAAAYMQTYDKGGKYQLHMDATPGQSRKLTAVTLLTNPAMYEGGDLKIYFHPKEFTVPRTRGTIVVFQPWLLHEVLPIVSGRRQTVNLGFWGPNFR